MQKTMKQKTFIAIVLGGLILSGCAQKTTQPPASDDSQNNGNSSTGEILKGEKDYTVSTTDSEVKWEGKKILVDSSHNGTINISNGIINTNDGKIEGGEFTLDMTSINNEDLEGEMKTKLEGHLKSEDFFSVESNPESTFVITSVEDNNGKSNITGDLTIKGITNSVSFTANTKVTADELEFEADFNIDRTDWDIRFGSGKFFEDLGDKIIDDNIKYSINIKARP